MVQDDLTGANSGKLVGWVNSDAQRSDAIAAALARALPLSMSLLGFSL